MAWMKLVMEVTEVKVIVIEVVMVFVGVIKMMVVIAVGVEKGGGVRFGDDGTGGKLW